MWERAGKCGYTTRRLNSGVYPSRLWPEDVERLHDLWLRRVVSLALRRLEHDISRVGADALVADLPRELRHSKEAH